MVKHRDTGRGTPHPFRLSCSNLRQRLDACSPAQLVAIEVPAAQGGGGWVYARFLTVFAGGGCRVRVLETGRAWDLPSSTECLPATLDYKHTRPHQP